MSNINILGTYSIYRTQCKIIELLNRLKINK